MRSILVRYTSSEYADSYLAGNLYLSSLSNFWAHPDEDNAIPKQQDFSEGVSAQIPRDILDKLDNQESISQYAMHDVRFRIEAYGFCNLMCFYRFEPKFLDVGNLSDIAEIVPASEIESKLQEIFPGYYFGIVNQVRRQSTGTLSYKEFRNKVISIDGKYRIIFEIG